MKRVETIAKCLAKDLNMEGLRRYLDWQTEAIRTAKEYGRSTKQYETYKAAAEKAIEIKKGE